MDESCGAHFAVEQIVAGFDLWQERLVADDLLRQRLARVQNVHPSTGVAGRSAGLGAASALLRKQKQYGTPATCPFVPLQLRDRAYALPKSRCSCLSTLARGIIFTLHESAALYRSICV
jgi:hypothetical protein